MRKIIKDISDEEISEEISSTPITIKFVVLMGFPMEYFKALIPDKKKKKFRRI